MENGKKVTWTSQSSGFTKTKTGTIVAVISTLEKPISKARIVNPGEMARSRQHSEAADWSAYPRDHESYLVLVPSASGKGKSTLYWPRVSQLNVVEEPVADVLETVVHGMENLSEAAAESARSASDFGKAIAPKSPWEFAKTLPTKARLNYIAESLKNKWTLAMMKTGTLAFGGMFIWDETPQGGHYWSRLIPA